MWSLSKNAENWIKYKVAKKDTQKVINKGRARAFDGLSQSLGSKIGEKVFTGLPKIDR